MKLTSTMLRKIIAEEVESVTQAAGRKANKAATPSYGRNYLASEDALDRFDVHWAQLKKKFPKLAAKVNLADFADAADAGLTRYASNIGLPGYEELEKEFFKYLDRVL